ncbi:hypothetical protein [Paraliomyxa miuraensis]|uniref:hypothetical protein n=1 Tax=Paraliomyxa miuraensis TaxID=376150 RepID=UPI0022519302|nr:hypothetical protein [Paraliomyxa miuraensis]MCX4247886.1 hypothetical protein [Paraliomyxa miuraensis]
MLRNTLILASFILVIGCDVEPSSSMRFRSAAEDGLVAFLGDHEVSTQDVLDFDCALRSDTARYIDDFRTGPDELYGTADDQVIDSEATLDSIYFVGPASIAKLYDCAELFGYIAPSCGQEGSWSETLGSGDDWEDAVPPGLVEEIEDYWGLYDLCGDYNGGMAPSYFSEVTINYSGCDVLTYEVTWVQAVEPGVQEVRVHYYDADLDLFDGSCEPGPA